MNLAKVSMNNFYDLYTFGTYLGLRERYYRLSTPWLYNITSIALEQIRNRQYAEKLLDYSGEIILVGINYTTNPDNDYKKHTCKIERIIK